MNSIGFQLNDEVPKNGSLPKISFPLPEPQMIRELDVRPILDAGKDPLKQIMFKINELAEGEVLKIVNTFEPLPLINLLASKGFGSHTEMINPKLINTYFFKTEPGVTTNDSAELISSRPLPDFEDLLRKFDQKLRVIDVTAYEMPKPMLTILETLETLGDDEALFVHHKKVPVYLLPHLHDKGFDYLIRQEAENKVSLLICKR